MSTALWCINILCLCFPFSSVSAMWRQHHLGQRHRLLASLPGGVPQLGRLLMADHRCPGLRHQAQLHSAASSWAARLHHRLVRHKLCYSTCTDNNFNNKFNWGKYPIKSLLRLNDSTSSWILFHQNCNFFNSLRASVPHSPLLHLTGIE